MQQSPRESSIHVEVSTIPSPDGDYNQRDILQLVLDSPAAISLIGTKICMASIKSSDSNDVMTERTRSNSSLAASPKFIESEQNEKFGFGFSKQGKPKSFQKTTVKPNSQFVAKIVTNEQVAKILLQKTAETFYIFFNIGKALVWTDYLWKLQSPLAVIHMKDSFVTCHDVNLVTRDLMNVVIGFSSGDILCFSPITGKYRRLNRAGAIHKFAITCISWIPGSESSFIAGFEDGSLMMFEKDLEDQNTPITSMPDDFFLRHAPNGSKNNPRTYWKLSKKSLTSVSMSPDFQHCSVTALDGTLQIIHCESGNRTDVYHSFFGGFLCSTWSLDGRFIIAGSQDDLLSIYAFKGRLLVRCQGHSSWPTGVCFDETKCTDRYFRFGSVGEDTKVCLWDFYLSSLRRPKNMNRSKSNNELADIGTIFHPTPSKSAVPIIEPIACKSIGHAPLSGIIFRDDAIVTSDRTGRVVVWNRPSNHATL